MDEPHITEYEQYDEPSFWRPETKKESQLGFLLVMGAIALLIAGVLLLAGKAHAF